MEKISKQLRHKNGFIFMLIIALLVQLCIPMSGSIISAEETLSTETSTLSTVSGSAVTVSGSAITASYINKIEIKDENGDDFTGEVEADSKILLKYSFEIPDDVIVDTTTVYTYTIPSEINIIENKTIEVKDGSRLVAMVNIKTDNTLTFQYMDEINNEDYLFDRSGFFWVYTEFDEIAIGNSGPKDIVFDLGGGSTTIIHVNFEQLPETADVRLVKSGSYNKDTNEILWTMKVTPETTPYRKAISNVVISDIIQTGQSYIDGSASIAPSADGGFEWNAATNTLAYRFYSDINTTDNEEYTITFKTKADTAAFLSEGATIQFKNQATATFNTDGSVISNEAVVNAVVDFIHKSGAYTFKRINWTIKINQNNLDIPDAVIKDKLPAGLTLDPDSVKLDGVSVPMGGDLTYDAPSGELIYSFPGPINKTYTFTYSTDVTDETAFDDNEANIFTNSVELSGTGVPDNAKYAVGVPVSTNVLKKEGAGYNRSTHMITWKITVNTNEISINNAKVTDHIPVGLKYVDGTYKVTKDGAVVTPGTLTYTEAGGGDSTKTGTLLYEFSSQINETYIITFVTEVLSNSVYAKNGTTTFNNKATLTGTNGVTGNPINSDSTGTQSVASEVIKKTGLSYDYITRELTWRIVVNQNNMPMQNAYVLDAIDEYQEFVPGSVKINGTDAAEGMLETTKDSYYYNDATKTLRYNFPANISAQQTITFRTKITDLSVFDTNNTKSVSNTANLLGDDIPTNTKSTGTRNIENTVVSKKGIYTTGNSYIDWEVDFNQNKVPIANAVLEDTLQEGLELDAAFIQLIRLDTGASNGALTEVEDVTADLLQVLYDVSTGKVTFTINGEVTSAYRLKFRTDIAEAYKNATFTNSINFKGSGLEQQGTSTAIGVSYQIVDGGAGGTGRGSITVIKVEEDNVSNYLQGATFELLDMYKNILQTSSATGTDGKVIFNKLKFNTTYYVREKTAPTGYELSNELYAFQVTEDTEETKNITYQYKNSKIRGNIEFHKIDEEGNPLAGAEFTIYPADDINFLSPIAVAISNEQGKVEFLNVEYGSYKIKETKAPEGYIPSEQVLVATISNNMVTVETIPVSLSNTKVRGKLQITKIAKDTLILLKDAKIAVFTENDVLVAEKLTDENGMVTFDNLPYGKYYFMEQQAPNGYEKNADKHPFEILENGKTIEVTFTNEKITIPPGTTNPVEEENEEEPGETDNPNDTEETDDSEDPNGTEDEDDSEEEPDNTSDNEEPSESIKEETTKDKDKNGKIDVPDGGTTNITEPPKNGEVIIDEEGNWIYSPDKDFVGTDEFTITVTHPDGTQEEILIEIEVEDIPLGAPGVLPKTGEPSSIGYYIGGIIALLFGLLWRRKLVLNRK